MFLLRIGLLLNMNPTRVQFRTGLRDANTATQGTSVLSSNLSCLSIKEIHELGSSAFSAVVADRYCAAVAAVVY